jgi:hypothetical protein
MLYRLSTNMLHCLGRGYFPPQWRSVEQPNTRQEVQVYPRGACTAVTTTTTRLPLNKPPTRACVALALTWLYVRDSSVGIVSSSRVERLRNRVSIPGKGKIFLFSGVQTGYGTQPASYPVGVGAKRSGREADHSPPSSVEVSSGGAIPPLNHRENSTLPNRSDK